MPWVAAATRCPQGILMARSVAIIRLFPLLYARESDAVVAALEEVTAPNKIKKVLKQYEPIKRMVYQNRGQKVREMFDRENLPDASRQSATESRKPVSGCDEPSQSS